MDKLVHTNQKPVISNDGASIMKLLDICHPAARTLVDIAQAQDAEVGDGTTTVVLLASEILKNSKEFINEGMHSQVIIRGIRKGLKKALETLNSIAVTISDEEPAQKRMMLEKVAGTALNSKLIRSHRDYFSPMIVDSVLMLDKDLDLSLIGIKKIPGGSVTDSKLIRGVAFEKTFSYAGFEQQPKFFSNPKILLLNLELELKSERDNAEVSFPPLMKIRSASLPKSTKASSMQSGRSSTTNLTPAFPSAPTSCFPANPSVTLPPSTSLTVACSLQVACRTRISSEWSVPQEGPFRVRCMVWVPTCWGHVEDSRRCRWVGRDTTSSRSVGTPARPRS
jgi:hypothetical protein